MNLLAIGLVSTVAGSVIWCVARGRIGTYWLALAVGVGAMTGMVGARLSQLPQTSRSGLVEQISAAIVVLAWWLVIRGAMHDRARAPADDDREGRWYLDD